MAKNYYLQNRFRSGEITPRVHYSFDEDRVRNGLAAMNNMLVFQQGGCTRRPQTTFVAPVKDSAANTRLINFEFNKDSENIYVIELGETYARFYKNKQQIRETGIAISGITEANPAVVTTATHSYSNGDHVYIDGIVGMTELNQRWFIVANKTATTFELTDLAGTNINSTSYTSYASAGETEKVYEIVTPWTAAQIDDVQYSQSADVVYMCHPDVSPRELSRTGDTSWSIADLTDYAGSGNSFSDGPYANENPTDTTLGLSATTGSVTVTASAITGINKGAGFKSTDVGRLIRFHDGTNWTWLYITAFTDTTHVTATIAGADSAVTTATVKWRLGSWSDTDGWPEVMAFYQNRLVFASTTELPETIFGSTGTSYLSFADTDPSGTVGAIGYDSYQFTTALSGAINRIVWLDPQTKLRIGTLGYIATLSNPTTDVSASLESSVSAKKVRPIPINTSTIFSERGGTKVRTLLSGDFSVDKLTALEISTLSEHLPKGVVIDMVYQEVPDSTVWCLLNNGTLLSLTYNEIEQLYAWIPHQIAGTDALVKSIASVPGTINTQLWTIVQRTINGATAQYVEYMEDQFEGTTTTEARYLDGGKIVTNSPASVTVDNLWHLEGETIQVLADGKVTPDATVTGGKITLTTAASTINVGYTYVSDLDFLPISEGSAVGTSVGSKGRLMEIILKLYKTTGFEAGKDSSSTNTSQRQFRVPGDLMGVGVPLFTGTKNITAGSWGKEASGYLKQTQPLPLTIHAVTLKIEISDN